MIEQLRRPNPEDMLEKPVKWGVQLPLWKSEEEISAAREIYYRVYESVENGPIGGGDPFREPFSEVDDLSDKLPKQKKDVLLGLNTATLLITAAVKYQQFRDSLRMRKETVDGIFATGTADIVEELAESPSGVLSKIGERVDSEGVLEILDIAETIAPAILNGNSDGAIKIISKLRSNTEQKASV